MADLLKIIAGILLIIIAWKLLKGILGILFTLAALGLLVWGGMKLLGSDTKRIR